MRKKTVTHAEKHYDVDKDIMVTANTPLIKDDQSSGTN
jgi:hypothetical protein